jgi:hypothetical protein
MAQLAQLLVGAGALRESQAEEARQMQIVYGDRIGTNLLARGFLKEAVLAQALGALHGVPYAAGKLADSLPQFTRGLHREAAMILKAVPARVDEDSAFVFVTDPRDPRVLAHLEQMLRKRVQPVVVCEARMWTLLHKFYLAPKAPRALQLDGDDTTTRHKIRPRAETRPISAYSSEGEAVLDDPTMPMWIPPAVSAELAAWSQSIPSATGAPAAPGMSAQVFKVDAHAKMEELAPVEELPPLIEGTLLAAKSDEARDTSPLTFAQAQQMLATARDRDEIALIVLRSCLSLFQRVVLLTVEDDLALGWDAVGTDMADIDVATIRLPLDMPSIFKLARDSRAHFLGPLPKEKINILFLKLTGGAIPKSALVVPVLVRGDVVNLLYCDNGKGQQVTTDIADMLLIAQHINRSYEALLRR